MTSLAFIAFVVGFTAGVSFNCRVFHHSPGLLKPVFKASFDFQRAGLEDRFQQPKRVMEYYAVEGDAGSESELDGDKGERSHLVMAWLLGPSIELDLLLKCHLLSDVLLDTSASPLRLALETTGLASAASPLCGLEESNREMSFMCGLEGCNSDNADEIEALILSTLEDVARDGIPVEKLEACLHQLELSQREIGGDGYPFGLQLIFSCLSAVTSGRPYCFARFGACAAKA